MTLGEESCLSSSDLPLVTRAASFIQINQIDRSFFVGVNGGNYLSTSLNSNLCEEFEFLPEGNLVLGCECGVVLGTEGQILWTSCNIPPYEGEIVEILPGINGSVLQTSAGLYSNAPMGEIPAVSAVVSGDIGRFHAYVLPETDCNTNGIEDVMDLELGTSSDFNQDGVPDECERDCDQDGIPDFIQIEQSVFADCDQSGVLDLCEIALGLRFDADGNGVPDRCERDCNLNGVPDFLDIFSGSVDVDSDGIPDECSTDCNPNDFGMYLMKVSFQIATPMACQMIVKLTPTGTPLLIRVIPMTMVMAFWMNATSTPLAEVIATAMVWMTSVKKDRILMEMALLTIVTRRSIGVIIGSDCQGDGIWICASWTATIAI